jgi:brefeldin A-resistance guanine nucleotide exchange factor 1
MPGEAQCIDRIMEAFSKKLFNDLGYGNPFLSDTAAFILAFSTIMLQTDLHNPNVSTKKMSREDFIKNNRGINENQNLPVEYLEKLYDEIKHKKIEVDVDINDTNFHQIFTLSDSSWKRFMNKSEEFQLPASFTPSILARKGDIKIENESELTLSSLHQKDMFLVIEERIVIAIMNAWQYCNDDTIISKYFYIIFVIT